MSTPRDEQHAKMLLAGIESTSRLLGLDEPAPSITEDMTPCANSDLPDAERDRLDNLFPGGWSARARRNGPDVIHAFNKVRAYYAEIITPTYGPKLIRDWDYPDSGPRDWAIVWEEGPDDWAITVSHADIFDASRVFAEPYNGWALCLYRP